MSIFTPANQVKLTNVSIVRLKKGGSRFELACYRNKVLEYRNKTTTDLDEVLQSRAIFTNVSKGALAKTQELQAAFGKTDVDEIIGQILMRGELQVSSQERKGQLEGRFKEVASMIATKCVNPDTKLPYPLGMVEQALQELHFAPNLAKSVKQQALETIKQLQATRQHDFALERAQMRVMVETGGREGGRVADELRNGVAGLVVEREERDGTADECRVTCLIDPGVFRQLHELVARTTKGKGAVHTLSLKAVAGTDDLL